MTKQDRFKYRVWDCIDCEYIEDSDIVRLTQYGKFVFNNATNNTEPELNPKRFVFEQCTGLRDKNDKLIYDNDLIMIGDKLYRVAIDDFGCRTVILDNNPFKEVIEWSDIVKIYYFYNRENEIEVVGNIRENADLLENKDE